MKLRELLEIVSRYDVIEIIDWDKHLEIIYHDYSQEVPEEYLDYYVFEISTGDNILFIEVRSGEYD